MTQGHALGRRGERVAADYLRRQGMRILARNYRCREGEVDIIARSGTVLVAVEVKTRRSGERAYPLLEVTDAQIGRIRRAAHLWRAAAGARGRIRVDGLGVIYDPDRGFAVRHLRGIA